MPDVLSYPFRIAPDGSAAKVEDLSEASIAQEIALLVLTEPGERPLVPEYGMDSTDDPDSVDELELTVRLDTFDIPARVTRISKFRDSDERMRVEIEFEPISPEGSYVDEDEIDSGGDEIVYPGETVELS